MSSSVINDARSNTNGDTPLLPINQTLNRTFLRTTPVVEEVPEKPDSREKEAPKEIPRVSLIEPENSKPLSVPEVSPKQSERKPAPVATQ